MYHTLGNKGLFFQAYEKEVRARRLTTGMNKDLENLFGDLRDTDDAMDTSKPKTTNKGTLKTKKPKAFGLSKVSTIRKKLVKTGSKLSVARRKITKAKKITKRRVR